ncbi:hypothetical protein IG631_18401 [Alternaria alternata]|nr:hypothetical protein IG631_18401 [Alternaria alternata]
MTTSLDQLPFDINHPYTEEALSARNEKNTYEQAFQAIYERRNALSTAYPYSARVLEQQGNSFVYRQGTICIFDAGMVYVLDLRTKRKPVHLDFSAIVRPVLESKFRAFGNFGLRLLHYADGILAVHATPKYSSDHSHIIAIHTAADLPVDQRVIESIQVARCSKLFARHNARYLYYGTHTGVGDDGHSKWEIDGISLCEDAELAERERPVLLDKFHGSDIGSTIAFEIHNDYFYAVSNQGTFEVEEIDYTSFYHVVRFPLKSPLPKDISRDERLYRRQHKQGPIHDSWTDLTLQLDERTNETVIVESRREWAQASSRQSRTFYVTKLDFREEDDMEESSDEPLLPEDDLYVPLIDSSNNAHWKPTPDLYSWSQHPEFSPTDPSPRSFILARTKFRAYNYACTSFVDLVEDERCCNDPSQPPCLRLRIGSRRELGLDCSATSCKGKAPIDEMKPNFLDTQTRYRHSPIRMWPPSASRCPCSKRLHNILNRPLPSASPSYTRSITGVLDEQRLIFMIKPGRSYGPSDDDTLGTIVVVDFSRPLTSTAHAPSASQPPSLSRCDSKMDDDVGVHVDELAWYWSSDSKGRCRGRTCQ